MISQERTELIMKQNNYLLSAWGGGTNICSCQLICGYFSTMKGGAVR